MQVEARQELAALKEQTGVVLDIDPDEIPESLEEADVHGHKHQDRRRGRRTGGHGFDS